MDEAHFPGRPPLDAYGGGGFRFADMSHRGSILIVPSGVYAWRPAAAGDIAPADVARVVAEAGGIELLLVGTGAAIVPLPAAVRASLSGAGVRVETMGTGAAARTYNVLLAEHRLVAAALIAVD